MNLGARTLRRLQPSEPIPARPIPVQRDNLGPERGRDLPTTTESVSLWVPVSCDANRTRVTRVSLGKLRAKQRAAQDSHVGFGDWEGVRAQLLT